MDPEERRRLKFYAIACKMRDWIEAAQLDKSIDFSGEHDTERKLLIREFDDYLESY